MNRVVTVICEKFADDRHLQIFLQFVSSPSSAVVQSYLVGKLMMEVLNLNIGLGQMLHCVLNQLLFFFLALFRLMGQLHKDHQDDYESSL